MKGLHMVTFLLVVIGAVNIGLMALFGLDLIGSILGSVPSVAKIVNILIGASGVYLVATHKGDCKICVK